VSRGRLKSFCASASLRFKLHNRIDPAAGAEACRKFVGTVYPKCREPASLGLDAICDKVNRRDAEARSPNDADCIAPKAEVLFRLYLRFARVATTLALCAIVSQRLRYCPAEIVIVPMSVRAWICGAYMSPTSPAGMANVPAVTARAM